MSKGPVVAAHSPVPVPKRAEVQVEDAAYQSGIEYTVLVAFGSVGDEEGPSGIGTQLAWHVAYNPEVGHESDRISRDPLPGSEVSILRRVYGEVYNVETPSVANERQVRMNSCSKVNRRSVSL